MPFMQDYEVKLPNFTLYGGRKQVTTKLCFSFWTWILSPGIQLQEGSPTFWRSNWKGIIASKTARTQVNFLSDVFVAIASFYASTFGASFSLSTPRQFAHIRHFQKTPEFILKVAFSLPSPSTQCSSFLLKDCKTPFGQGLIGTFAWFTMIRVIVDH